MDPRGVWEVQGPLAISGPGGLRAQIHRNGTGVFRRISGGFRGLHALQKLAGIQGLQVLQEPSRGLQEPHSPPQIQEGRLGFKSSTSKTFRVQAPQASPAPPETSRPPPASRSLPVLQGFQMSRSRNSLKAWSRIFPKDGLFGKGTYLAEDAAKIDQYLKQDLEWRGNKPDHELQKLDEVGVKQRCCCC